MKYNLFPITNVWRNNVKMPVNDTNDKGSLSGLYN